jgi:hypothetical protein
MPTPSSNTAPALLPPTAHSSSTCPDDLQHPSRPSRTDGADISSMDTDHMEVQHELSAGDVSTSERSASADPMSRATTMSPRPQPGVTISTSPVPAGHDIEVLKHHDHMIEDTSCQETLPKVQRMAECTAESPGRESRPYSPDLEEEDAGYMLPSMGPEYSSMRVSVTACCIRNMFCLVKF